MLVAAAAAAGLWFGHRSSAPAQPWSSFTQRVGGRNPVLVAGQGGIFIVGATGESVRRLTDFGSNPAWSPDAQSIVFSSEEVGGVYSRGGVSTRGPLS